MPIKQAKNKTTEIEELTKNFISFLQRKDLKFTRQREAISEWIFLSSNHFTADDLVMAFHSQKWVSKATIYRTLGLMVEAALLVEQDFGEGYKTYENIHIKKHHDHLICLNCGKIAEFESEEIEKLQERVAAKEGYKLKKHILKLFGICASCQKQIKQSPKAGL